MADYLTAFFGLLLSASMAWLLGFRFLFTRKCVEGSFLEIGVARKKVQRTFVELRRKSFHLLGLLIPFIYYFALIKGLLDRESATLVLGAVTVFLWAVEGARFLSPGFRRLYNAVFGKMLRRGEMSAGEGGEPFRCTGTGFFFLGSWVAVALFEPLVAMAAILYLVLGDLSAALVGIGFGRIKIGKKSLEGTLAMFAVCYGVTLVLFWHAPFQEYLCLAGAISASLVELLNPPFLDDNLTIPLLSGAALHLAILRTSAVAALPGESPAPLGHIPSL